MGVQPGHLSLIDDATRLAALRDSTLLVEGHDDSFAPLVQLAARMFDAPMSSVSLVDDERQVFKACHGFSIEKAQKELAICAHTVRSGALMTIEDTHLDERFANHPLIVGDPYIRSYAGDVIRLPDGQIAGAICIVDTRPRTFSEEQLQMLRHLAKVANELILSKVNAVALERQADLLETKDIERAQVTRYLEQAERIGKIGHWSIAGSEEMQFSRQTYALHELPFGDPMTVDRAVDFYRLEDRDHIRSTVLRAIETQSDFEMEGTLVTAGGNERRVRSIGVATIDERGYPQVFGVVQDISAESEQRNQLRWAATHDPLTGLLNRRAFHEEGLVWTRKERDELFLALLDLDNLKLINDVHGHAAGDFALRAVADEMSLRFPDALVARLGGDEFGMLVKGNEEAVRDRLSDLADILHQPRDSGYGQLPIGATIGLSRVREDRSLSAAEQRADAALYHGKQGERGGVIRHRPTIEQRVSARLEQTAMVKQALKENQLRTYFQPIVDLRDGRMVGAEALVRMERGGRIVPAEQFYLGFGDSRVAAQLFDQVIGESVALLADKPTLKSISVNVAPSDLVAPRFALSLLDRLAASNVDPGRLVIEITESTLLLGEQSRVRTILAKLRSAGVGVALDDFGTGYSSLSHVSDFPITRLKIDKRFVNRMGRHDRERAVTLAIINLALQLGLEIVAEGIEDEDTRAMLQVAGCQFGQGFLWSPAVPSIDHLLAANGTAGVARKA